MQITAFKANIKWGSDLKSLSLEACDIRSNNKEALSECGSTIDE